MIDTTLDPKQRTSLCQEYHRNLAQQRARSYLPSHLVRINLVAAFSFASVAFFSQISVGLRHLQRKQPVRLRANARCEQCQTHAEQDKTSSIQGNTHLCGQSQAPLESSATTLVPRRARGSSQSTRLHVAGLYQHGRRAADARQKCYAAMCHNYTLTPIARYKIDKNP